jgi:hypothetical protein
MGRQEMSGKKVVKKAGEEKEGREQGKGCKADRKRKLDGEKQDRLVFYHSQTWAIHLARSVFFFSLALIKG